MLLWFTITGPTSFRTVGHSGGGSLSIGPHVDLYAGLANRSSPQARNVAFTVNGAIDKMKRASYFYIDPSDSNKEVLLPAVTSGKYVMFHGPRASGKSTRMFHACEQLSGDYFVMDVTLQSGVDVESADNFWSTLVANLQGTWTQLPLVRNASEFTSLFTLANKDILFGGKSVVLFIDEFDVLEYADTGVRDAVLSVLRGLKQDGAKNCLHSVVAVGPFSILRLNTAASGSPFNVADAVPVALFTKKDVESLFLQLASVRRVAVEDGIPTDIYDRTDGNPGLVAWCGKMIDEKLISQPGSGTVTLSMWEGWAAQHLISTLSGWPTMGKMTDVLEKNNSDIQSAVNLLITCFLPAPGWVDLPKLDDVRLAEFLVAEGALRGSEYAQRFAVRNSLVRCVLLAHVLPKSQRPAVLAPFPFTADGFDTTTMLETAVANFSKSAIKEAAGRSYKRFEGRDHGHRVPHEFAYHFELFSVLQIWAPRHVFIGPEVKQSSGATRADILVLRSDTNTSIVLELVANTVEKDVTEHCIRAETYRRGLNATEAVVVHFISCWPPLEMPPAHKAHGTVTLLSVYHDSEFENRKCVWSL